MAHYSSVGPDAEGLQLHPGPDSAGRPNGLLDRIETVTSWNGRAIVPDDHPRTLGALHGSGTPEIEDFYDTADAMLVAGSRLRGHETLMFKLRLPQMRIHIDVDGLANGRTYPCDHFICGDAAVALAGLADRLDGRMAVDSGFGEDLRAAKLRAETAYRETLGPYRDFPEQLRKALPPDAVWVRDATVGASTWGHRLMPLSTPRSSVHPVGAAIGPGLPLAIGASFAARGRKTVALVGDGGFALGMAELWTVAQERPDLCLIVMNDGRYAAIQHLQDQHAGGRRFYGDLLGPDLLKLAELTGLPSWRVSRSDEFGATVARAIATPGPTLVEVDMGSIGPAPACRIVVGP